MIDRGTLPLETERLRLRRFTIDDAGDMFDNWAADEMVTAYLCWAAHSALADSRKIIEEWLAGYADKRQYLWCIEHKADQKAIGSIGVVARNPETLIMDIGYCLSRRYWGRDLMPEALNSVVRYLFDRVGVPGLEARIDQRNTKSKRVLEKCGFRFDRIETGDDRNRFGRYDAHIFSLKQS